LEQVANEEQRTLLRQAIFARNLNLPLFPGAASDDDMQVLDNLLLVDGSLFVFCPVQYVQATSPKAREHGGAHLSGRRMALQKWKRQCKTKRELTTYDRGRPHSVTISVLPWKESKQPQQGNEDLNLPFTQRVGPWAIMLSVVERLL